MKGKRLLTLIGSACLILALAALPFMAACTPEPTPTPTPEKPVTLRFATYCPPQGMEGECSTWMMDEITKRTNGKVEFEQYFGESLLKSREILRGVQEQSTDMGYLFVPYYVKELGQWTVATPFLNGPADPKERADLFWELYEESPELEAQLASWNQKLIAIHVFGNLSVGGPRPLATLADLKGLKVRCAGGYDAEHMSALGATIVFMPGPEVYSAMEKGAVDASYTAFTSYHKYRFYEIGDHYLLIIPQFCGAIGLITINLDTWNSLSSSVQDAISEVGKEYSIIQPEKVLALEKEYEDEMIAAGCTIIEVSEEEVQHWADISEEDCKAKWVEETETQGLPGKKLMERAIQLIERYSH